MQLPAIFTTYPYDIILALMIIVLLFLIIIYLIIIIIRVVKRGDCLLTISPGKDKPLPDGGYTVTISPGKDKPLPDDGPGT